MTENSDELQVSDSAPTDAVAAEETDPSFEDRDVRVPYHDGDQQVEPPSLEELAAIAAAGDVTESEVTVVPEPPTPAASPSTESHAAHEAFVAGAKAHAEALGLTWQTQTAYYKVSESETGHKLYIAKTARDKTPIHIETTLELVGRIDGATLPKKQNGKIAAVVPPDLEVVTQVLGLMASKSMGKVRPAKTK